MFEAPQYGYNLELPKFPIENKIFNKVNSLTTLSILTYFQTNFIFTNGSSNIFQL